MIIDFSLPDFFNSLNPQNEFEAKVVLFLKEWFSETLTVKVQTSGSTGVPKILEIKKSRMRNSAKLTCDFLDLNSGNSALICLPIDYISGKMMIVRSIERKLKLFVCEPSVKPLEFLHSEIDFCAMTPLQAEHSLNKIGLIKKLIIGGAAVSESLKQKLKTKLLKTENQQQCHTEQSRSASIIKPQSSTQKVKTSHDLSQPTIIYETYGMSETLSHIALKEIFPKDRDYFQLFPDIKISADERGCLKINAPKLNPETLQTNDIVEIKNDKEFRFLGRIDNVINSGGVKIFPEELENLVKKNIPNEVVFLGFPDEILGQKLVLVVEKQEDINLIQDQVSNLKFQHSFHKPKDVVFVEKIPRTANGKINRLELINLLIKESHQV
ncbi:MAG: long-chain fatty acid--CoA ligase [Flavobacteriaceae bacterium]|jgi:O-succinylbenzoic acid--CoA ligase|nr:long-chain fatty acid--CoA ligase [Flavobacteriaceae bacterium]